MSASIKSWVTAYEPLFLIIMLTIEKKKKHFITQYFQFFTKVTQILREAREIFPFTSLDSMFRVKESVVWATDLGGRHYFHMQMMESQSWLVVDTDPSSQLSQCLGISCSPMIREPAIPWEWVCAKEAKNTEHARSHANEFSSAVSRL